MHQPSGEHAPDPSNTDSDCSEPVEPDVGEEEPVEPAPALEPDQLAVRSIFRSHAALKSTLTANLAPLRVESQAVAARVERAFDAFQPVPLTPEERERRNYVEPGEDVAVALDRAVKDGVDALRDSDAHAGITVRRHAELPEWASAAFDEWPKPHKVDLHAVVEYVTGQSQGPALVKLPTPAPRVAEAAAEALIAEIEGVEATDQAPEDDADAGVRKDDVQFVNDAVDLQMRSATSPESPLSYGHVPTIPNTAGDDPAQKKIQDTFELRPGASDVTSYHDFPTLQIAFPHVWTRVFDGELESLGRELYAEYVKLKDFAGSEAVDLSVGSLDDLRALIEEIRKLSQTVERDIPDDLQGSEPSTGAKGSDDLSKGVQVAVGVATGGVSWLLEWALDEFSKIGRKPIIKWEDFPGPLPGHNDLIECSIVNGVAPAGIAELILKTDPGSKIKIMELELWDGARFGHGPRLDNRNGWTQTLPVSSGWLSTGVIEFASEETSQYDTPGRYVLGDLNRKLKDRGRVTFHWKGLV